MTWIIARVGEGIHAGTDSTRINAIDAHVGVHFQFFGQNLTTLPSMWLAMLIDLKNHSYTTISYVENYALLTGGWLEFEEGKAGGEITIAITKII